MGKTLTTWQALSVGNPGPIRNVRRLSVQLNAVKTPKAQRSSYLMSRFAAYTKTSVQLEGIMQDLQKLKFIAGQTRNMKFHSGIRRDAKRVCVIERR
jgi:hypothetical protein